MFGLPSPLRVEKVHRPGRKGKELLVEASSAIYPILDGALADIFNNVSL
jgi:hypothetical protein